MRTPLNGRKTHPLSEHALDVLESLANGRIESYRINAGVINRLMREDLAEPVTVLGQAPEKDKFYLRITDAGRAALARVPQP